MIGFSVKLTRICNHHEESGEQFGSWSKNSSWIPPTFINFEKDTPDINTSLDLENGDDVFMVWAVWSEGDTFGQHSGAEAEPFAIFKDEGCAKEFEAFLNSVEDAGKKPYVFVSSDGQKFSFRGFPWFGYFENLDYVEVSKVIINK